MPICGAVQFSGWQHFCGHQRSPPPPPTCSRRIPQHTCYGPGVLLDVCPPAVRWLDIWRRWYHWALVPATCQGELPLPGVVKAIKHVVCSFVIPDTELINTWLLSLQETRTLWNSYWRLKIFQGVSIVFFFCLFLSVAPVMVSVLSLSFVMYSSFVLYVSLSLPKTTARSGGEGWRLAEWLHYKV